MPLLPDFGALQSQSPRVVLAGLSLSVVCFILLIHFRSPLHRIKGPWLTSVSAVPLFIAALQGKKAMWIRSLHVQYGPVVRIAPNKVCVSAEEGVKLIYNNKISKSHAYDVFRFRDVKMCIGLLGVKEAHTRRKSLLPAFSRANLMEMEPVIRSHLEHFLDWLSKCERDGKPIDVFKWFRYLTFDVITDVAFGQQIGMLKTEDTHFITQIEMRNKRNGLIGMFPILKPIMKVVTPKVAAAWFGADEEIAKYAIRARDMWSKAGPENRHRVDILSRIEEDGQKNPDAALSAQEIIAEMMEILNAGSDTTANTAMFTTWELSRHPEIQEKLHQELAEAFPDPTEPLKLERLEKLPFLDGVCREGLRLHAPIPAYLERVAGEGGLNIAGNHIKEGTIVGMQAYTNHRNEQVYPEPESFVPERWFEPTAAMKLNFLPFSAGPRACIGLNLANMQLRIHLGHIFHRYLVTPAPWTTPESMSHVEFFVIRPKNGRCDLYFRQH